MLERLLQSIPFILIGAFIAWIILQIPQVKASATITNIVYGLFLLILVLYLLQVFTGWVAP